MMNKTITKRLSIALCIILLLFVSLGICFAGNFGTTPVAAAEQTTVANMTRLCFVFEISAEQYNLTTEGTRLTEKGDIRLTLTDCTQKTDNATFPVNFIFFFDEISLQA